MDFKKAGKGKIFAILCVSFKLADKIEIAFSGMANISQGFPAKDSAFDRANKFQSQEENSIRECPTADLFSVVLFPRF